MDLQHSAIWMAGVYLMILMQFLENKVAMELTRSEFVEAQEVCFRPITFGLPFHIYIKILYESNMNRAFSCLYEPIGTKPPFYVLF